MALSGINRRIIRLAVPNIISNITVPLLGMVDLAIVGHIGDETYIGAIAIGTMIFNFIYWNFGFLRMGTAGFTAQAYGAGNLKETVDILVRSAAISLVIALILIVLQYPIGKCALLVINGNPVIEDLAYRYFKIRIWAAPATLGMYAFKGWFIGMQNSKTPMTIAIVINVLNVIFSLLFVMVFNMKIEGVALGTMLAQWCGMIMSVLLWWKYYRKLFHYVSLRNSLHLKGMRRFFNVNADIFLRSLCLATVFSFFPIAGARMGDIILAVNTLLLQYFTIFSYIMDGFAYAGESLTGKYIGAKDAKALRMSIKNILRWGVALSLLFTVVYAFFGNSLLKLFTDKADIIASAGPFYFWVLMVPVTGFSAFLWDGIFVGATASKSMRNCMFVATAVFFLLYYGLSPIMGNNALWLAFIVFLVLRGLLQHLSASKAVYARID